MIEPEAIIRSVQSIEYRTDEKRFIVQICHVYETACFESGGIVRCIYDQGRGIARRGHEVELITCDSSSRVEQLSKAWGGQVRIHGVTRMGVMGFICNRKVDPKLAKCIENVLLSIFTASGRPKRWSQRGMRIRWAFRLW